MPGREKRLRWSRLVPCSAITSASKGESSSCPKGGNPSGRNLGRQSGPRAPSGSWVMSKV